MKKYLAAFLFLVSMHVTVAQFAPPAGQPGTTAMYMDSTAFVSWATGSKITRGYLNISNPSAGYPTLGDSNSVIGKPDGIKIVSLGDGGSAIVTFKLPIANGLGYDFAVFENSFSDTFLELAFVEVSSDGIHFFRFSATSNTSTEVQLDNAAEMDAKLINNLAGKYRALYGAPFDLQELAGTAGLDINKVTHVKIIDVVGSIQSPYATYDHNGKKINDPWPTAFPSCGFDLDAIGVINQTIPSIISEHSSIIQFNVFPNPVTAAGKIQLMLNEPQSITIDILDLTGRQVALIADKIQAQETNLISLEQLNLKNGVYLLRATTEQAFKTEKIIISNE